VQVSQRKLLILDLDETLIYATEEALERKADITVATYFVYKRPYLKEFLDFCFANFDVAVWTTSTSDYAREIIDKCFNQDPIFIWSRERCTHTYDAEMQEHYYIKKMSKLRRQGYKLESVIAVDDSANVWTNSYGNLVRVMRFEGDETDTELKRLLLYLGSLLDAADIRKIEKRNWRSKISADSI
jgi:RNA polymerase II subunit A small phosphatase-like protein